MMANRAYEIMGYRTALEVGVDWQALSSYGESRGVFREKVRTEGLRGSPAVARRSFRGLLGETEGVAVYENGTSRGVFEQKERVPGEAELCQAEMVRGRGVECHSHDLLRLFPCDLSRGCPMRE